MRRAFVIMLRDILTFFYTPIFYVVWAMFLFLNGWAFSLVINSLNSPLGGVQILPTEVFFGGTFFFWVTILLMVPLLTMRSISEEKRQDIFEMVFTTPVKEWEYVIGKYASALFIFLLIWASSAIYVLLLWGQLSFDIGALACAFLGVALLGAALVAVGIFASSLTANQIIAGTVSFAIILFLFSVGLLSNFSYGAIRDIAAHMNMIDQFQKFAKGIIDIRAVVYFISIAFIFLFSAIRVIESRRWRL